MRDSLGMLGLKACTRLFTRFNLRPSFSQEGEDLILARVFEADRIGFFIDVGAHHPVRFSNTLLLYLRGWNGINVDAMPGSMDRFRRWRPRDINVEAAIGCDPQPALFHVFHEPALNTFDEALAQERQRLGWRLDRTVEMPARKLAEVWDEFVPRGVTVDLLTVDVEGRDADVLNSLDWARQQPRVVCVEVLEGPGNGVFAAMKQRGYSPIGHTLNTHIFRRVT